MDISIVQHTDTYVLTLSGRWDAYSATTFEEQCSKCIDNGMKNIVLDLAYVDYISSFGLRSLLNVGKCIDQIGGTIAVCAMVPYVSKLFIGSGFASLFPQFSSVEEGLSHIKNM